MKKVWYVLSMALILLIASCQSDNPSMITLGLDDTYVVERMKGLTLHPGFTGERYEWALSYESDSVSVTDSIVATTRDYTFVASETGTYRLRFQIYDAANPITHLMRIVVRKEEVAYSPYITKVYEYRPAPGQFVNELPKYTEGDTEESMRQKVEDCLAYDARTMVSLGGYGGYIVVGFDHTIVNRPGEYDFKILGNAFYANDNPRPDAPLGGSSEPGIVMVSVDTNGNGVPDDEWYELAGSEYYKKETLKNYEITYYRPDENKEPVTCSNPNITDSTYVRWTDNYGNTGYISQLTFHDSSSMSFRNIPREIPKNLCGRKSKIVWHTMPVRWSRWEATADILSSVSTIRLSIGRENTISKYWVMHFMPMTILVPMPRWEVVANPG